MKKILASVICILLTNSLLRAQIDEQLREDIRNTGYVHSPLALDYSKSFETFGLRKKVVISDMLCDMESIGKWTHKGFGNMYLTSQRNISGKSIM